MEKATNQTESLQTMVVDSSNKQNKSVTQSNDEGLLDFSSMFKKNGFIKRPAPKLGQNRKAQSSEPNWLLQIPAKLQIRLKDLEQRRYINEEKWKMMIKTSQFQNASIYALVSSLNYLIKSHSVQTQALTFNGIKENVLEKNLINKEMTRRQTILLCCQLISNFYKIENLSTQVHQIIQEGKNKQFLKYVLESQASKKKAFMYVCYGQLLLPIGFENTPLVPLDAYKTLEQIKPQNMEMWIIFASPLKTQAPLVIKRWSDVEKEMGSRWPQYLDLNETKKGRQVWDKKNDEAVSAWTKQVSCWIELSLDQ